MLSGGTQSSALPRQQGEEMKILNIEWESNPQLSRLQSHPCGTQRHGNSYLINLIISTSYVMKICAMFLTGRSY